MTNERRKPKRNYTVSERVLAACRINVEKARKAALERRFCAARGTMPSTRLATRVSELAQRDGARTTPTSTAPFSGTACW
jgi:hypothetical protein